jgi:sugar phosphate permease
MDGRMCEWALTARLTGLLYLISFLDRTNIGNAKIEGLVEDLGMTAAQYNACLTIFFVSYALFEPLSNILLKWMRPRIYIPVIMLAWGLCMTCEPPPFLPYCVANAWLMVP